MVFAQRILASGPGRKATFRRPLTILFERFTFTQVSASPAGHDSIQGHLGGPFLVMGPRRYLFDHFLETVALFAEGQSLNLPPVRKLRFV